MPRIDRMCEVCGEIFSVWPSRLRAGVRQATACSRECFSQIPKPPRRQRSEAEFFDSHFSQSDGCWEWAGTRNQQGYGRVWHPGYRRELMAHRFAWERELGPVPDGMSVCHHCDNPPCVRPSHLFLGTQLDNNRDMIAKGRDGFIGDRNWQRKRPTETMSGTRNGRAKLTPEIIAEIRSRYLSTREGISQTALARQYGVHQTHISRIVHGQAWS